MNHVLHCRGRTDSPIRYYHVSTVNGSFALQALKTDEAYLVPNFELAEELVARGVDSARIAISHGSSPNGSSHGYSQIALGRPLVPASPFTFDQSIVIVLPTYNERSNLAALVATIGKYLTADILIVDDNSPDGTGQVADQLRGEHRHIHVLHRPKNKGLGRLTWLGLSGRSTETMTVLSRWIVISATRLGTYPAWSTAAGPPSWLLAVVMCPVVAPRIGTLDDAWCLAAATPM